MNLSKFPYDFIIHFFACFIPVYFQPTWQMCTVVLTYMIYLKYAQKSQVWYNNLTWKEYFIKHSLRDIIADILGVTLAMVFN